MLKRFIWGGILLAAAAGFAQENLTTWTAYKPIVVNTKASGANMVGGNLTNYPLLVRLGASEAALFAQAGTGGASIRFAKPNGTKLPYAISQWDAVGQTAAIWVLMDTVKADDSSAALRIYWGKSGAADSSRTSAVFDTLNGFTGVWHMDEAKGTGPKNFSARSSSLDFTAHDSVLSVAGVIGKGRYYNSHDSSKTGTVNAKMWADSIANNIAPLQASGATTVMTFSAWVNRTVPSAITDQGMFSKYRYSAGNNRSYDFAMSNATDSAFGLFRVRTSTQGSSDSRTLTGNTQIALNTWTHVMATVTSGTAPVVKMWVNGVAQTVAGTNTVSTNATTGSQVFAAPDTNGRVLLGAQEKNFNQRFVGILDEVRFDNGVARDSNWAKLSYETQKPTASALALGTTVTQVSGTPPTNLRYEAGNADANDTLAFVTGTAVNIFPTYSGGPADSIKTIGAATLPAGVTLTKATGLLSGTPTATLASTAFTFRAYAAGDSTSRTVVISSIAGLSNLRYVSANTGVTDTLVLTLGIAGNIVPTVSGGTPDSVAITSGATSLPAGVTLNKTTGALTGTPTAAFGAANRTLTAYKGVSSTARQILISAVIGPIAGLNYSDTTVSFPVGTSVKAMLPSWSSLGRTPTSFSVTPALPAGLGINPLTGVITGAPSAAAANANYTVRAMNTTDTTTKVLHITVTATAADGIYATAWSRHRDVVLNTTATGANVTANLTGFPVLIRLGAADSVVFSNANSTGRDIRFTKSNNTTRIPHEIEFWDAAGRSAAIWVRLDTVYGNNATQSFKMHYGNSSAVNQSNGQAVFDTASGYLGIWHMGTATGALPRANSVDGGYPAIPTASDSNLASGFVPVAGVIGKADTLRNRSNSGTVASEDHFNLGPAGYIFTGGQVTMSMWMRIAPFPGTDYIHFLSFGNGTLNNNIWFGRLGSTNNFATRSSNGVVESGNPELTQITDALLPISTWAHFAVVRSGTNGQTRTVYKDGAVIAGPVVGDTTHAINPVSRTLNYIGRSVWGDRTFRGLVDEVRVERTARSADWMKLSFENQKAAAAMVTFANDAPTSIQRAAQTAGSFLTAKPLGFGMLFTVQSPVSASLRISIVDMQGRKVWSRATTMNAGLNTVEWNGFSGNGQMLSAGVYNVRATLLNAKGETAATLERKIPLTR